MVRNAAAFEVPADNHEYAPGSYRFIHREGVDGPVGIIHGCPCGCGAGSAMFFKGRGDGRAEWDVSGEWPNVTLSPSIGIRKDAGGSFHWHGFLENGVFVER